MPETPRATTAFPAPRIKGSAGSTATTPAETEEASRPVDNGPAPYSEPEPAQPAPKPAPARQQAPTRPAPDQTADTTRRAPAAARPAPRTAERPAAERPAAERPAARTTEQDVRQPRTARPDEQPPSRQQAAPPRRRPAPRPPQDDDLAQAETLLGSSSYDDDLFGDSTTSQDAVRPHQGFRGVVYDLTGGRINLGRSADEIRRDELSNAVRREIPGDTRHIMVWSQKGGVGKTTTSVQLGITLASLRTDKILGLDVNPDGGSMALRVPRTTRKNILDLRNALASVLANNQPPLSPTEFDGYVNHASHRFDTVVMPPGDKPKYPLTGQDYRMIASALQRFYPYKLMITDCGTNLTDQVMDGVINRADQLVVVTTTVKDETQVTARGLAAMVRAGHGDLVRNAITVLVEKAPRSSNVDVRKRLEATADEIRDYYGRHTRQVISVPYDPIIQAGDILDPKTRGPETELAQLEIAAAVVESLATAAPRRPRAAPGAQRR